MTPDAVLAGLHQRQNHDTLRHFMTLAVVCFLLVLLLVLLLSALMSVPVQTRASLTAQFAAGVSGCRYSLSPPPRLH